MVDLHYKQGKSYVLQHVHLLIMTVSTGDDDVLEGALYHDDDDDDDVQPALVPNPNDPICSLRCCMYLLQGQVQSDQQSFRSSQV